MRTVAWILALAACSPKDEETIGDTAGTATDPDAEMLATAEALYAPDRVVQIDIEMAVADANALGAQTRSLLDLISGADCLDHPADDPFTYFPADVTVDGVTLKQSGISKKGLIGSLSTEKPSLKIDFAQYVPDQTYGGLDRLTLNNAISDPSLVKQCLGYQLFRDAGLVAPRCNFAHVTVDGQDLGVYVNVEPVKKPFLKANYGGKDDGDLYEGTLSDVRDGWLGTFDPKTDDTDPTMAALQDFADILAIPDDDAMLAALDTRLDREKFADYWALEVLIAQGDGYTGNANNFFVYRVEDSDRFEFLPWGIDATFMDFAAYGFDTTTVSLFASNLPNRLWRIKKEQNRYRDHMQLLLDTVWDESAMQAEIDRMTALVDPYALPDPNREPTLDALRTFVDGRRAAMTALLDAPMPEASELRASPCIVNAGHLSFDFDTTFGTLESLDPLGEGSSSAFGELSGLPIDWTGSAIAGDSYGTTLIGGLTLLSPTILEEAVVAIPTYALAPGTFPADNFTAAVLLIDVDLVTGEETVRGSMWDGVVTLEAGSAVDGARLAGHAEGDLWASPGG